MGMRLGKNLVIIRHLKKNNIKRVLVVTEKGAMSDWYKECNRENVKSCIITGDLEQKKYTLESFYPIHWIIINYHSCESLNIHTYQWDAIILDEPMCLCNPKNNLSKYFLRYFKHVRLKYLLNGYPNPENYMQLCNQFIFVEGSYMGCKNYWDYRHKYYVEVGHNWTAKHGHFKEVYKYIHKRAFILSREEAKVGPLKVYKIVKVPIHPKQKEAFKTLAETYEIDGIQYNNDLSLLVGAAYISGGITPKGTKLGENKLIMLFELLKRLNESKVLIWCRFIKEQEIIYHYLLNNDISCLFINGDFSKGNRDWIREAFKNEFHKVAILTIQSCAKGQDWSIANTSIYYSNVWSNDLRTQSEDRIVHIEKTGEVTIIDLLTNESTDSEIYDGLKMKKDESQMVTDSFLKRYLNV